MPPQETPDAADAVFPKASPPSADLPMLLVQDCGIPDDPKLADHIIARLNALLDHSDDTRRDIASLLLTRVQVFSATANHPTLQVDQEHEEMPATLGVLGLLNGLCGTIKPIAVAREEDAALVERALSTQNANLVEQALTTFPDTTLKSLSDEHGLTYSDELEAYGFITAVWEDGQLVRFERTKLAARVPVSDAPPPPAAPVEKVRFLVNGVLHEREPGDMRYAEVLHLAGEDPSAIRTVTWKRTDGQGGTLAPTQQMTLYRGTVFNVSDTSGA